MIIFKSEVNLYINRKPHLHIIFLMYTKTVFSLAYSLVHSLIIHKMKKIIHQNIHYQYCLCRQKSSKLTKRWWSSVSAQLWSYFQQNVTAVNFFCQWSFKLRNRTKKAISSNSYLNVPESDFTRFSFPAQEVEHNKVLNKISLPKVSN